MHIRKITEDRGASAVEYGMMVAAIAAVIVGVVFGMGQLVGSAFSHTCSVMAANPANMGDPAGCGGTTGGSGDNTVGGTADDTGTPPPEPTVP